MISGTVAPGYERARDRFAENFASHKEVGGPCVVSVDGELATGGDKLGITPDTLDALTEATTPPTDGKFDQVLQAETTFSLGYCEPWPSFEFGSDKAFGTMGAGGSFGSADPELGLGFGYVMNRMDFYVWDDPREHPLREAATECARATRS
jgi:CubicO group peptidase (beta-lactamase class C family)